MGLPFQELFDRGLGLPIKNVSCDYTHPVQYGDELTLETEVAALSERTVTLQFTFTNERKTVAAEGSLTAAFFDIENQQAAAIPDDIRRKIEAV